MSVMRVWSSLSDIIPAEFLLEVMDCIGPYWPSIINSSLSRGSPSDYFEIASVQPVLKKFSSACH